MGLLKQIHAIDCIKMFRNSFIKDIFSFKINLFFIATDFLKNKSRDFLLYQQFFC
jgi:hypothetical protein